MVIILHQNPSKPSVHEEVKMLNMLQLRKTKNHYIYKLFSKKIIFKLKPQEILIKNAIRAELGQHYTFLRSLTYTLDLIG